jgi:hypothetical protein
VKTYAVHFPDDEQRTYETSTLPSGEVSFHFKEAELKALREADEFNVTADLQGPNAFMQLAHLTDALDGANLVAKRRLILPYLPYGKAVSRTVEGGSFGLKAFAKQLVQLCYDTVVTVDNFSEEARKEIPNLVSLSTGPLAKQILSESVDGIKIVLYPDEDAQKRYPLPGRSLLCPVGGVPPEDAFGNATTVLVVSPVYDGGRALVELGSKIAAYKMDTFLYVAHGIFPDGIDELGTYYKHIFTTDSFNDRYSVLGYTNRGVVTRIPLASFIKKHLTEMNANLCIR